MDLRGEGVLALWNGIDPARQPEYDLWHSREHVPERVTVEGIHGARRYRRVEGPLPEYLTIYDLSAIGVLTSPPYLKLLDNPTAWSRSMRPSFRGFLRLCCRRTLSVGGGLGAALGAATLADGPQLRSQALLSTIAGLTSQPGILAVHLLLRDPAVPPVPFAVGGPPPDVPDGGALLFEGYDDQALADAFPAVRQALDASAGPTSGLTRYRLASALDRTSLASLTPAPSAASALRDRLPGRP